MELPQLGQHCSQSMCNQLDFLPVKCDACRKIFCKDHYQYSTHSCPESYKKNKQVPVCPLCNTPVPTKPGVSPDITVGDHIDRSCQADPAVAKRKKVFTNKCFMKGCKQKEMIPIKCDGCQHNYCLKHRHTADHNCVPSSGGSRPSSRTAAGQNVFRMRTSASMGSVPSSASRTTSKAPGRTTPTSTNPGSVIRLQGNMNDDEALATALQLSLMAQTAQNGEGSHLRRRDDEDYLLARAIAASQADEEDRQRRQISRARERNAAKRSSCFLS